MKWELGNTYQISFENIKNETKKPKPKTKKPFLCSSEGISSTPQHTDSHPCTRKAETPHNYAFRPNPKPYTKPELSLSIGIKLVGMGAVSVWETLGATES